MKNSDAKKIVSTTYSEVIQKRLGVMDATAVTLCRENGIPIIVFKLLESGNLQRVILGEPVGSIVKGEQDD